MAPSKNASAAKVAAAGAKPAAALPQAPRPPAAKAPEKSGPAAVALVAAPPAEPASTARPTVARENAHKASADEAGADAGLVIPTPAEVATAVKTLRIEGVSADKAGVERLSATAVHLRAGRVVKVGALFPSGERLLAVEPENGRIITNQRQILMFFN